MKLILFISGFLCISHSFGQLSKEETLANRVQHESEIRDTSNHMLDSLERAEWLGLDYFDFDESYQIKARFKKKKGPKFEMLTSTERLPVYRRYGYIYFTMDSVEHRLTVYQNVALVKREGYEDYLFIPFRDATKGKETYGGGRYMDTRIPDGKEILLDFNQAYNPYCAYSHHYSCPIPPEENSLKIRIEAGEKKPLAR